MDMMMLQKIGFAVVIAATPLITIAVCRVLDSVREIIELRVDNEMYESFILEILDAVETAVVAVNQSYVDNLKAENLFDEAAQKEAFNRAMTIVKSRLSRVAKDVLTEIYGDLDEYLTAMIEAEVHTCKK